VTTVTAYSDLSIQTGDATEAYARKVEAWSSTEQWRLEMTAFLARIGLGGANVLDFGCGAGRAYSVVEKLGASSYQGFDINPFYRYGKLGLQGGIHLLKPGQKLPLQDASFDVAFMFHVLPHLDAPLESLADIRRCVRPGGLIGISVTNANFWRVSLLSRWWDGYREDPTVRSRLTIGSMLPLMRKYGRIIFAATYGPRYMWIGPRLRAHLWIEVE
jgi:SAM-dependent methyltransferase